MKNIRLFGIVYILLSRGTVTAKELAEHFEVSVRTIYRDIEQLSSMNIPVYMVKGKNGGISLMENYRLDRAMLTEEEQKQVLFALQSLESLNTGKNDVLDKFKAIFNKDSKDWICVDFSVWGKSDAHGSFFNTVKLAVLNSKRIEFLYFNSKGEKSLRKAEPLQILFKHNAWYIFAFDTEKQDYRLFKMTRIKDMKLLDEAFIRKMPEREFDGERKINTVSLVLEISPQMAYRVYDEFEGDCISIKENGKFIVSAEYPEDEWVYGYILSFGEYARVISPERVKAVIRQRLQSSIKNYL